MLTLYHAQHSRSTRIIWLLEELGADYTIKHVGIRYGGGRGGEPDPVNIHPDKKVPALLHDDALVTESTAIALYLCDLHPEAVLAPPAGTPQRGAFLTWLCWTDNELGAALIPRMNDGIEGERATYDGAIRRLLQALGSGPFLMGERFTAADVMTAPLVAFARAHLPPDPAIDAYLRRVTARPAFLRARAKDEPLAQAA